MKLKVSSYLYVIYVNISNMIHFIVKGYAPRSYNSNSREAYKARLQGTCSRFYRGKIPKYASEDELYGLAYYFYKGNCTIDADNISKPIWDAFQGIVYEDDRQITFRIASIINVDNHDISFFDFSELPGGLAADITSTLVENNVKLIYIECGKVGEKLWNFNLEQICK